MPGSDSPPFETSPQDRSQRVSRVLARVLFLNVAVAVAKIAYGHVSGAVSILSDGFHSLTDAASNIVALVAVRASGKPPDRNHPYGHRKYETLAAGAIFVFLSLVVVEVVETAVARMREGASPTVTAVSFGVMLMTMAVNLAVVRYESRAGRRLGSELLRADAMHTWSDVLTSTTVIAALAGVWLGWPLLDAIAGLILAVFIARTGYGIALEASGILSDRRVIDENELRREVMRVPGILGCHQIRTRGSADHVFLDMHVWLEPDTPLDEAHRISHVVKDRLMTRFPAIADAILHIEPPPGSWNRPARHGAA